MHDLWSRISEHANDLAIVLTARQQTGIPGAYLEIGKLIAVAALSSLTTNMLTTVRLEERQQYVQEQVKAIREENAITKQTLESIAGDLKLLQWRMEHPPASSIKGGSTSWDSSTDSSTILSNGKVVTPIIKTIVVAKPVSG